MSMRSSLRVSVMGGIRGHNNWSPEGGQPGAMPAPSQSSPAGARRPHFLRYGDAFRQNSPAGAVSPAPSSVADSDRLPRMGRPAVILLILASLAWQSVAAMALAVVPGGRAQIVHSVMHWQEIPHHHGHEHHHDSSVDPADPGHDGDAGPAVHDEAGVSSAGLALHLDDSIESHGHLAAGHGSTPALVSGILTPPPVPVGIMPGLAPAHPERPPLPDGLFRPPRSVPA